MQSPGVMNQFMRKWSGNWGSINQILICGVSCDICLPTGADQSERLGAGSVSCLNLNLHHFVKWRQSLETPMQIYFFSAYLSLTLADLLVAHRSQVLGLECRQFEMDIPSAYPCRCSGKCVNCPFLLLRWRERWFLCTCCITPYYVYNYA